MTTDGRVMFWIGILFVMVSSVLSVHEGDHMAVCYRNVSFTLSVNVSYTEMYKENIPSLWCLSIRGVNCSETRSRTAYKTEYKLIWALKEKCCPGYEYKNGTCMPQYSPACINGYCAQPNIRGCDYGWGGDTCGESVLCYIALVDPFSHSKAPSEVRVRKNLKDVTDNSLGDWKKLPECPPEYLGKVQDKDVYSTRRGNVTFYFVPIHSSRATVAALWNPSKNHIIIIGTVMGIILALMVIGAVCIVQRKRRSSKSVKSGSEKDSESIRIHEVTGRTPIDDCDYVNPVAIHDYDVQNTWPIFACDSMDTKEIRDYDDVYPGPIRVYENVEPRPIPVYDNFNAEPIRDYENVNPVTIRNCDVGTTKRINYHDVISSEPIREYENFETEQSYECDDHEYVEIRRSRW